MAMTGDGFRALTLSLDGVEERAYMGHPDFRLGGRIFASLMADERRGMVKITPGEQAVLIAQAPETFVPAAGAWGRQGCTMIDLAAPPPRLSGRGPRSPFDSPHVLGGTLVRPGPAVPPFRHSALPCAHAARASVLRP